jgi:hypothetical protein
MPAPACSRLHLKLVVLVILAFGTALITTAGPAHAVDTLARATRLIQQKG